MPARQPPRRVCTKPRLSARIALTLIELLFTIAVIGILAAILIPQLSGNLPDRLNAGAQIVCADLDYARALAVSNNSTYRITFESDKNRYYLKHSGTRAQLNTLPRSPFRQPDDPPDQQTTDLSQLPLPEPGVRLVTVVQTAGPGQSIATIEFTPLGGTTSAVPTTIWLTCGGGSAQRYIALSVSPTTGLATIEPLQTSLPQSVANIVHVDAAVAPVQVNVNADR